MKRIIVAMDESLNSRAAARLASTIAKAHAAKLILYHAVSPLSHLSLSTGLTKTYELDLVEDWKQRLELIKSELLEANGEIEIDCLCTSANAALGIMRAAVDLDVQLIAVGANSDSESSLLFGSVSTKVARDASVPVLVASSDQQGRFPADGLFRNPLVAVDYSKFSVPAVTLAASLSGPQESVELVHVYFAPDIDDDGDLAAALADARGRELARLNRLAERTDVASIAIKSRVEGGRVARQLLDLVENSRTDLLVLGAHGRTGDIAILGTSADRLIRLSQSPVVVIPDGAVAVSES